jgi:hypothetical protein
VREVNVQMHMQMLLLLLLLGEWLEAVRNNEVT